MELQTDTEMLSYALRCAQGITKKGGPMPILASVLIEATHGSFRVSAFDGGMGLRGDYQAAVSKPGAIALRQKELSDIVRSLPVGTMTLRTTPAHKARIEAGRAVFNLSGQAPEDFPALPRVESSNPMSLDADMLLGLIERTDFAMADETRPGLSGVYFESNSDGVVRLVAADGHRLALAEAQTRGSFSQQGVLIPRKAVVELKRLLADADGPVLLGFTASACVVEAGSLQLVAGLQEGAFPDYERVIPRAPERQLNVEREALVETLQRLGTIASGALRVDIEDGSARFSAQNPDLGDATEELAIHYQGEPLTIGFNAKYLLDVLGVLDSQSVDIGLGDETAPAVIRPGGEGGFTAIVMPMSVTV